MSNNSLAQQFQDAALGARINAAANREAWENPTLGATQFGQALKVTPSMSGVFNVPVSIATEAQYAYALQVGNPNPGGDETVITDADILAAVQATWPPDPA